MSEKTGLSRRAMLRIGAGIAGVVGLSNVLDNLGLEEKTEPVIDLTKQTMPVSAPDTVTVTPYPTHTPYPTQPPRATDSPLPTPTPEIRVSRTREEALTATVLTSNSEIFMSPGNFALANVSYPEKYGFGENPYLKWKSVTAYQWLETSKNAKRNDSVVRLVEAMLQRYEQITKNPEKEIARYIDLNVKQIGEMTTMLERITDRSKEIWLTLGWRENNLTSNARSSHGDLNPPGGDGPLNPNVNFYHVVAEVNGREFHFNSSYGPLASNEKMSRAKLFALPIDGKMVVFPHPPQAGIVSDGPSNFLAGAMLYEQAMKELKSNESFKPLISPKNLDSFKNYGVDPSQVLEEDIAYFIYHWGPLPAKERLKSYENPYVSGHTDPSKDVTSFFRTRVENKPWGNKLYRLSFNGQEYYSSTPKLPEREQKFVEQNLPFIGKLKTAFNNVNKDFGGGGWPRITADGFALLSLVSSDKDAVNSLRDTWPTSTKFYQTLNVLSQMLSDHPDFKQNYLLSAGRALESRESSIFDQIGKEISDNSPKAFSSDYTRIGELAIWDGRLMIMPGEDKTDATAIIRIEEAVKILRKWAPWDPDQVYGSEFRKLANSSPVMKKWFNEWFPMTMQKYVFPLIAKYK